jgi:hypothetical protein
MVKQKRMKRLRQAEIQSLLRATLSSRLPQKKDRKIKNPETESKKKQTSVESKEGCVDGGSSGRFDC